MSYKIVGDTLAEWSDTAPFVFRLTVDTGPAHARQTATITVDLSELQQGFTNDFLMHLKELLIEWRNLVALNTIENYSQKLQSLFRKVIALSLFDAKIDVIDESFLLVLNAAKEQLAEIPLLYLKNAFTAAPYSLLWAPQLHISDFPQFVHKKGFHGQQIDRILARALPRAACVHILSRCEQAYDVGEMDISHFAFANLAFAVFCRPESYRQIQLDDLVFDKKSRTYFLYILPKKTRVRHPEKICYRINEPVGILLQKQRQNVTDRYGHLVDPQDIGKLALFPARRLTANKSAWIHAYANGHFGMYGDAEPFMHAYPSEIRRTFLGSRFTLGANVLRHTVGTQLAQTGASARTIQGVLKHATDNVCKAYVDIAFHGLIDELSDAMRTPFDAHLPVFERFRSKRDPVNIKQAIRADDPETGQIELTGECGKHIQCEFAPITCYGCTRFIPCWDADHGVNLATVQREIDDYKQRGKPFEHMVEKALEAKYQIVLVMNAADRYRQNQNTEVRT